MGKSYAPPMPVFRATDIAKHSKDGIRSKPSNKKPYESNKSTGIDSFSISSISNMFDSSTDFTSSSDFNGGGGDFGGGGASDSY